MNRFLILLLGLSLSLTACGKNYEFPKASTMSAAAEINGISASFNHGFLYESPYSEPAAREFVLILMKDQVALQEYAAKLEQHNAPPITDHQQLLFFMRLNQDATGYEGEVIISEGLTEAKMLTGFALEGAAEKPFPEDNYPGTIKITQAGGTETFVISLNTAGSDSDGNSYKISVDVNTQRMDFAF